jgi:hypothetical protein
MVLRPSDSFDPDAVMSLVVFLSLAKVQEGMRYSTRTYGHLPSNYCPLGYKPDPIKSKILPQMPEWPLKLALVYNGSFQFSCLLQRQSCELIFFQKCQHSLRKPSTTRTDSRAGKGQSGNTPRQMTGLFLSRGTCEETIPKLSKERWSGWLCHRWNITRQLSYLRLT